MMKRGNTPSRVAGFTLVELLLAITLMSILLGLTYTGLRAATRSSERGEELLAMGGDMRSTHQFIRRQLSQMVPLTYSVEEGAEDLRVVFEGDASSIQFVAPMPGYLGAGGPQVQLVELVNGNDGDIIVQFSHALLQGFEEARLSDREPVILLEGASSAGFEFLAMGEDGELTGWTTNWDQTNLLPVAVRLNLEYPEEAQLRWPELVADAKVDAQAVANAMATGRANYKSAIKGMKNERDRP